MVAINILPELRQCKLPQLAGIGVFLPHILRPKGASVHVVFQVIPDDVRLLKEQPHAAVRQCDRASSVVEISRIIRRYFPFHPNEMSSEF